MTQDEKLNWSTITWPKKCNMCNQEYSIEEWEKLHYSGVMIATFLGFPADLEHRMCANCGNDMTQPTVSFKEVINVYNE